MSKERKSLCCVAPKMSLEKLLEGMQCNGVLQDPPEIRFYYSKEKGLDRVWIDGIFYNFYFVEEHKIFCPEYGYNGAFILTKESQS